MECRCRNIRAARTGRHVAVRLELPAAAGDTAAGACGKRAVPVAPAVCRGADRAAGDMPGRALPAGMMRLADTNEQAIPWAWAINGFASVVGTVPAALLVIHPRNSS